MACLKGPGSQTRPPSKEWRGHAERLESAKATKHKAWQGGGEGYDDNDGDGGTKHGSCFKCGRAGHWYGPPLVPLSPPCRATVPPWYGRRRFVHAL
eukprot:319134-Pyramimonas_sp.AAC.2